MKNHKLRITVITEPEGVILGGNRGLATHIYQHLSKSGFNVIASDQLKYEMEHINGGDTDLLGINLIKNSNRTIVVDFDDGVTHDCV